MHDNVKVYQMKKLRRNLETNKKHLAIAESIDWISIPLVYSQ